MNLMMLRQWLKKNWLGVPVSVWIIVGIALAIKVGFLITYQDGRFFNDYVRASDGKHYNVIAENMLAGKGFMLWGHPTSYRPPLYPVMLFLSFLVFGKSVLIVRFIQVAISAATCLIVYQLAKESVNERIGVLSALFTMLYFRFTFWSIYILTETVYVFLSVLTFLFLISALKSNKHSRFFSAGLLWGVTFLCRPEFGGFLAFVIGYLALRDGLFTKRFVQRAMLLVAGLFIAISPWVIRNAKIGRAHV